MDAMYVDALERFCIDKSHCFLDGLSKLKEVYSYLAQDYLTDEILEGNLNQILEKVYKEVSLQIGLYLEENYHEGTYIEVTDKEGTRFVGYELNEQSMIDIKKVIEQLKNCNPDCSDLSKTRFNNYLDKTIDFNELVNANVDYLIQYLVDEDIVNPGDEV